MNESVAVTKVADTQKDSSPTWSDNSGHRAHNEPEMQLGSLRGVINLIRLDGGTPSVDSIATQLSGMTSTGRASVLQALQQTHGNLSVQQVVLGVQAKLMVGQPNDRYEQEADCVADAVMRTSEPEVQRQLEEEEEKKEDEELVQTKTIADQNTPLVQRQVEEDEEEDEDELIQSKPLAGQITPLVQRQPEGVVVQSKSEKSVSSYYPGRYVPQVAAWIQAKLKVGQPGDIYEQEADSVVGAVMQMPNPNVQRQANDTKEKLPIQVKTITPIRTLKVQRQKVEGFGYDFGQVRVPHNMTKIAHALKARAFTVGQDIIFGSGQYSPRSVEGRKLLAHELTHTIQQSKNGSKQPLSHDSSKKSNV